MLNQLKTTSRLTEVIDPNIVTSGGLGSNRPEGSRRGALAPVGAILGLIVGAVVFAFSGSLLAILIAPVVGVSLAILFAPAMLNQV